MSNKTKNVTKSEVDDVRSFLEEEITDEITEETRSESDEQEHDSAQDEKDIEIAALKEKIAKLEEAKGPHTTRPMKPLIKDGKEYTGPVVRVHREDGVYKKKIPMNLQGLSSQMLPPITKRKLAVYEAIGRGEIDPLTGQPLDIAPPVILPGKFVVYDPFNPEINKRNVLLKNVTRSEHIVRNGVDMVEEIVEDLVIDNGFKQVNQEKDYLEYALWELHPLNESNKWRDKSQAAAFRRADVIVRKDWSETSAGMDLAFEAETAVVKMIKSDQIIAYATACGINTAGRMLDKGDDCVKVDLRKFARQNPLAFFKIVPESEMAIKMSCLEAIDLGLIEYDVDKRQWVFCTDGDLVCQHLPGENPMDTMVKMLMKDSYKEAYGKIQEQLNFWN
jgi:hypothetical protein